MGKKKLSFLPCESFLSCCAPPYRSCALCWRRRTGRLSDGTSVAPARRTSRRASARTGSARSHDDRWRLTGPWTGLPSICAARPSAGSPHDAFFVTTTYGKTLAIDADSGAVLWEYTPASYESLKATYRITNATPVADDDRKLHLFRRTGRDDQEAGGGGWPGGVGNSDHAAGGAGEDRITALFLSMAR